MDIFTLSVFQIIYFIKKYPSTKGLRLWCKCMLKWIHKTKYKANCITKEYTHLRCYGNLPFHIVLKRNCNHSIGMGPINLLNPATCLLDVTYAKRYTYQTAQLLYARFHSNHVQLLTTMDAKTTHFPFNMTS